MTGVVLSANDQGERQPMTHIDQFSLATAPLEQYFNDTYLGQGTGFIWERRGQLYLVTNWHVVAMWDFFKREQLHDKAARPNKFRTRLNTKIGSFERQQWDLPVRDDDDEPLWLIHPGRRVDVAVLPLHLGRENALLHVLPVNQISSKMIPLEIGMEVFVLGYPFKIQPPAFPVWKRGSVATEPDLAPLTTNYMLVDTASRPGMSGAPVIRRDWRPRAPAPEPKSHPATEFVGIYSGRMPTDHPYEAQLGLVWEGRLIDEIIDCAHRDDGSYH